MCLESNCIDPKSVRLYESDDFRCRSCFGTVVLEIVIVVVQLSSGVNLSGEFEREWNESFADCIVEDRGAVCSVFVES